ncbi:MAG: hypothetical protein GVY16_06210 [Planctomycetes bacterium]|jgi:hypothetical protein|nr:hypothetical protein [Phycisphaerae bacterium]NBB95317.1 hypothetical protein [Planctomycetota bacterium]
MATTDTPPEGGFFTQLAASKSQTDEMLSEAAQSVRAVAAQYDVHAISSTELNVMSSDLYDAGIISREEFAMLSFQPEMSNNYDAVGAQGIKRPDPTRNRDALAEWERILRTQEQLGSSDYFTEKTRGVVSLLRRLADLRDAD